jgi:hypothetical protein
MKKLLILLCVFILSVPTFCDTSNIKDDIIFYPTKDGVYSLYNEYEYSEVSCIDMFGNVVFNIELNSVYSIINLSALKKGIYTVKIVTKSETVIKKINI